MLHVLQVIQINCVVNINMYSIDLLFYDRLYQLKSNEVKFTQSSF